MSETEKTDAPPIASAELTFEEAQRFLDAKWRLTQCEVCLKESDWTVDPGMLWVVPAGVRGKPSILHAKYLKVSLTVHCENCGNQKLIATQVVKRWLSENQL